MAFEELLGLRATRTNPEFAKRFGDLRIGLRPRDEATKYLGAASPINDLGEILELLADVLPEIAGVRKRHFLRDPLTESLDQHRCLVWPPPIDGGFSGARLFGDGIYCNLFKTPLFQQLRGGIEDPFAHFFVTRTTRSL
jgi:hypothetical protein